MRLVRAGLLAVALAGGGLTTYSPIDSTATTTLIPGWERYFTVEWTAGPEHGGVRRIDGYVYNRYGEYAADVRLLVQSLDASGNVVGQRVVWGPTGVGGESSAYARRVVFAPSGRAIVRTSSLMRRTVARTPAAASLVASAREPVAAPLLPSRITPSG